VFVGLFDSSGIVWSADVDVDSERMVLIPEVRFYPGVPAEGVSFPRDPWRIPIGEPEADYVECNGGRNAEATWQAPGPVRFSRFPRKALQPFASQEYETLDALAIDIMNARISLIDQREIRRVRDFEHFSNLLQTHKLERFRSETIFIKRRQDGSHEDIWQLPEDVFKPMLWNRLIKVSRDRNRQTYVATSKTLDDLSEFGKNWIVGSFSPKPVAAKIESQAAVTVPTVITFPPEVSAIERITEPRPPKAREPRVDTSAVFTYDDIGNPITELDLTRESTRTVPRNMPTNLIPEVPDGCSDDDWEKLMLAEQIKFRRRTERKASAGAR
jgi:hypothetical protein